MASLRKRTRGGSLMFEIDFYTNGQRKTIPLGVKYAEKTAENLLEIVEMLLRCKDNGVMILDKREQTRMQTWIETAPQEIRQKLAKAGLIEIPPTYTLKELWDKFLEQKELDRKAGRIKEGTVGQYEVAKNRFFETFKETDQLTDISKEMLAGWNEVYNKYGAFKESQWIGHSSRVRADHYLMITDDDYLNVSESGNIPAISTVSSNVKHYSLMA